MTNFLSCVINPKLRLRSISCLREVEPEHEELVVDDRHLAVIAWQVVRGSGDRHARLEQARLQLSQEFLAAAIRVGDEHADDDAPSDGRGERLLQVHTIESEDHQIDGGLGMSARPSSGA